MDEYESVDRLFLLLYLCVRVSKLGTHLELSIIYTIRYKRDLRLFSYLLALSLQYMHCLSYINVHIHAHTRRWHVLFDSQAKFELYSIYVVDTEFA